MPPDQTNGTSGDSDTRRYPEPKFGSQIEQRPSEQHSGRPLRPSRCKRSNPKLIIKLEGKTEPPVLTSNKICTFLGRAVSDPLRNKPLVLGHGLSHAVWTLPHFLTDFRRFFSQIFSTLRPLRSLHPTPTHHARSLPRLRQASPPAPPSSSRAPTHQTATRITPPHSPGSTPSPRPARLPSGPRATLFSPGTGPAPHLTRMHHMHDAPPQARAMPLCPGRSGG